MRTPARSSQSLFVRVLDEAPAVGPPLAAEAEEKCSSSHCSLLEPRLCPPGVVVPDRVADLAPLRVREVGAAAAAPRCEADLLLDNLPGVVEPLWWR